MPNHEIEEFAKSLVQNVRDAAIRSGDHLAGINEEYGGAKRLMQGAAANGNGEEVLDSLISEIVDDTMFQLLFAIDDKALPLSYTASNGKSVDLVKDGLGELGGWYAGSPSWRDEFTRERFVNENADLDDCGFDDPIDLK